MEALSAEFSARFDVLYNNITSNQAPGLNEYEKSLFLTKGQDEVVKNHFVPEGNPHQKGFDGSQKRQIDFSMLMKSGKGTSNMKAGTIDPRAYTYILPEEVMFIINESIQFTDSESEETKVLGIRQVIPVTYEEYMRLMSKPFKEPAKFQAWRLISGKQELENEYVPMVEIIITTDDKETYSVDHPQGNNMNYVIRYVKRPKPIILTDLTNAFGEGLTINGKSEESLCELSPVLYEEIIQRAVELAKVAWVSTGQDNTQAFIQAGQRSE